MSISKTLAKIKDIKTQWSKYYFSGEDVLFQILYEMAPPENDADHAMSERLYNLARSVYLDNRKLYPLSLAENRVTRKLPEFCYEIPFL